MSTAHWVFSSSIPSSQTSCPVPCKYKEMCVTLGTVPPLIKSPRHQTQNLRRERTPHSVPAAVYGFAKESAGAYQIVPRLPHEPIATSQTGFKTNQTAKQHHRKSLPLSAPSSPTKEKKMIHPTQEQSVPPWVVWGGTSVLCVFRANVHEPEGVVETITLNSAMGKRMTISLCFTMFSSVWTKRSI